MHEYTPDPEGLYDKYRVVNQQGQRVHPVFVLRPEDPSAVSAMLEYARSIEHHNPKLCADLMRLCDKHSPIARTRPICANCGGSNISTTANARWDYVTQDWVVSDAWGDDWCSDCDGEVRLKWIVEEEESEEVKEEFGSWEARLFQ